MPLEQPGAEFDVGKLRGRRGKSVGASLFTCGGSDEHLQPLARGKPEVIRGLKDDPENRGADALRVEDLQRVALTVVHEEPFERELESLEQDGDLEVDREIDRHTKRERGQYGHGHIVVLANKSDDSVDKTDCDSERHH